MGLSGGHARALAHRACGRPTRAGDRRPRRRAPACSPCSIRSQLAALLAALALGLLALVWRTGAMRRWRATWTPGTGPAASALGRRRRDRVRRVHGPPLGRVGDRGDRLEGPDGRVRQLGRRGVRDRDRHAAGDRAARGARRARPGARAPGRPRLRRRLARAPSWASRWYAAIKGAYLSTTFSSLIVERNLVYLTPLAFVATAYLLERAAAPVWAVSPPARRCSRWCSGSRSTAALDNFPYYEAHGLAILALANREFAWPLDRIESVAVRDRPAVARPRSSPSARALRPRVRSASRCRS